MIKKIEENKQQECIIYDQGKIHLFQILHKDLITFSNHRETIITVAEVDVIEVSYVCFVKIH